MSDRQICIDGETLTAIGPADARTPPIVLLHSLALDRTLWEPVVPELRRLADVVWCDLPGHGRSCPIDDTTVEEMADEAATFLRASGLEDGVVVIGLSLGGCVAQALALAHPELVRGLVLCDTTAWYGEDGPSSWAERAAQAREHGMAWLGEFQLDRWFAPVFREANPELCDRLLKVFTANDLDSYEASCRALGAFNAQDRLGQIAVPTSVIVGADDYATPVSFAEVLAAQIPDAHLRVIEGTRHLTPLEAPTVFAEEVRQLLARA